MNLQGHGTKGHFGGIQGNNDSQIVIIPVPFDKTSTYQKGSDKGPQALIEASRNLELYDIETDSEVYLKGIFTDKPVLATTSKKMLELTYTRALQWLKKNKFIVVLGGEHTISYAPIKAILHQYKALTVLQLDAHADLQPAYENNPWSHASVMARVKELPGITTVAVGVRSLSKEEIPYIDNTFFSHQLDPKDKWMEKVLKKIKGPTYLTFDLDVLDPSILPSTGTPEPGGLLWETTLKFLKKLFIEKEVVGLDIVELLPKKNEPNSDYLAAKLLYKMLTYKFL